MLRYGANADVFDPVRFDKKALRDKWGISHGLQLVLFTGKLSVYKGLDDLLAALELIGRPDVMLLMAGASKPPESHAHRVLHLGLLPHAAMPELLAMADLVALPQRQHLAAQAQVPAKLFEAMSMAKPVVVTRMSDLPDLVGGGGLVVEPGNVAELAGAIQAILADPTRAQEMGELACRRHRDEYSWDAMERVLNDVMRPFA
jgi:glycosyltransferase involved in cell wall biosynthesis